jgi:hypothetical protein
MGDHFSPEADDHRSSDTMTASRTYQASSPPSEPIHRIQVVPSKDGICNRAGIMMRRRPLPTGLLRYWALS